METSLGSSRKVPPDAATMRTGNGKGKVRLLTRASLDGRTRARRQFDAIAEGIAADLSPDQLSTVRKHLIEAFAGMAVVMNDLNARMLAGESIDLSEQAQTATTLTRLATRIGLARIPRDVTGDATMRIFNDELARLEAEDAP
jgi:hypothetical protein